MRNEKWKVIRKKNDWLFFYNCVTTGRRGVGFEKLPYTFRKDFGGAVKWGKEHFWNIYNRTINAKFVSLFPLRNAQRWSSSFFPTVSFHSMQTTTRTGLHCCEKSKCISICHIVQLMLQEIKKTETSYLKLTNNALFEVMAMKRAIVVGYWFMLPNCIFWMFIWYSGCQGIPFGCLQTCGGRTLLPEYFPAQTW